MTDNKLVFNVEELNLILRALKKLPHEESNSLIVKMIQWDEANKKLVETQEEAK